MAKETINKTSELYSILDGDNCYGNNKARKGAWVVQELIAVSNRAVRECFSDTSAKIGKHHHMDMGEEGDPGRENSACRVPEAAVLGVLQEEQGGQDGWREEGKREEQE